MIINEMFLPPAALRGPDFKNLDKWVLGIRACPDTQRKTCFGKLFLKVWPPAGELWRK
jgi:hypothetical protein